MDNGFPMFRIMGDEIRAALNSKRTALKNAERLSWEIGRDHAMALLEDKLRHIKAIRAKTAKVNAVLQEGKITDIKAFERLMLKGV